jgi:hypothetical protein
MDRNSDILRRLVRPLTIAELSAFLRASNAPGSREQLTLAYVALEEEARELFARRHDKDAVGEQTCRSEADDTGATSPV